MRPPGPRAAALLLLLGGLALATGIVRSAPPEPIDVEQALRQVASRRVRHVALRARLEGERRLHATPLRRPAWSRACRPHERLLLEPGADLSRLAGCSVALAPPRALELVVRLQDGTLGTSSGVFRVDDERYLAAAPGWSERLWLLSPNLLALPALAEEFPGRALYAGVLTRATDLAENVPEAARMTARLDDALRRELGRGLAAEAHVLIVDRPAHAPPGSHDYVPVAGSGDGLFARLPADGAAPAALRGTLAPVDAETRLALGAALGVELPEGVGVLTPGGARPLQPGIALGALLLLAGSALALVPARSPATPHTPRPPLA